MSRSNEPFQFIKSATLDWTDDGQPLSTQFNDCYFSCEDGLAESSHVFINGNALEQRWQNFSANHFTIGETGFGTGLNFVAAWQLWQQTAALEPQRPQLHFISCELHPPAIDDMRRAAALWPTLTPLYNQLLDQYPVLTPGMHRLVFEQVTLTLLFGDACEMFAQLIPEHANFSRQHSNKVNAWFLDGFAPAKNPQLWQPELYHSLAALSADAATVATFSAAGDVRRGLQQAGFTVGKQPGFGRKRDMLTARLTHHVELSEPTEPTQKPATPPWYITGYTPACEREICIIGAGIAGSCLAHKFARQGYKVTVLEQHASCAQGASGNAQAVLYTRLSATASPLAEFVLASYLYALRFYRMFYCEHGHLSHNFSGILQLATNNKDIALHDSLQDFIAHHPEIAHAVTAEQASEISGIDLQFGGLFFPDSGWINPQQLCHTLLDHPNITCHYETSVRDITRDNNRWHCHNISHGKPNNIQTPTLVIAGGHHSHEHSCTKQIPIKPIRGQVTYPNSTTDSERLNTVICAEGYVAPASKQQHVIGATYNFDHANPGLVSEDHQRNLQHLARIHPALAQHWLPQADSYGGKVGFRATTPDYLPLCGPIPDHDAFVETYAALRKNAKVDIPVAGDYLPDLYLCSGLGSRGMTYAPLCAELLFNQITGTPSPLPQHLVTTLNPARFIIRKLIKNRD